MFVTFLERPGIGIVEALPPAVLGIETSLLVLE
jgi:hypothetical protein